MRMPFLIPALVTLSSDAVILILGQGLLAAPHGNGAGEGGDSWGADDAGGRGSDDAYNQQDDDNGSSHHCTCVQTVK